MKILLLDDHKIFGQSLKQLLKEQDDIELCDYISSIDKLFRRLKVEKYDIILIDINLKHKITGLELIEKILNKYQNQKIIILTSCDLDNYRNTALKLGAKDFINKSIEIEDLFKRIKDVYEGRYKNIYKVNTDLLTKRELEVLNELIRGG